MTLNVSIEVEAELHKLDIDRFKQEILKEGKKVLFLDQYAPRMERIVQTWRNKPRFVGWGTWREPGRVVLNIGVAHGENISAEEYHQRQTGIYHGYPPGELLWKWLSGGVKGHTIVPKRAKYLRFKSGFSAKTAPRMLMSRPGGYFGDWVTTNRVDWPGIAPREFELSILKDIGQDMVFGLMEKIYQNAMKRATITEEMRGNASEGFFKRVASFFRGLF